MDNALSEKNYIHVCVYNTTFPVQNRERPGR